MNRGYLAMALIALTPLVIYLAVNAFAAPIPAPMPRNGEPPLKCLLKVREPKEQLELLSNRLLEGLKSHPGKPVRMPTEASGNPLLFSEDYAYVLLRNTGPKESTCYSLREGTHRPLNSQPSIEGCFDVNIKTWDPQGRDISKPKWHGLNLGVTPPEPAVVAFLVDEKWPTVGLEPGGKWELPCSLFPAEITEPGTYTIQAVVKYLEAPGKQERTIETEKLKVEISKPHVMEAKEFFGEKTK
jgi:hypothetical protein